MTSLLLNDGSVNKQMPLLLSIQTSRSVFTTNDFITVYSNEWSVPTNKWTSLLSIQTSGCVQTNDFITVYSNEWAWPCKQMTSTLSNRPRVGVTSTITDFSTVQLNEWVRSLAKQMTPILSNQTGVTLQTNDSQYCPFKRVGVSSQTIDFTLCNQRVRVSKQANAFIIVHLNGKE
jgi:hypothetical protein